MRLNFCKLWRSLVGCSPWGRKESDTTERLHFHFSLSCIGEGNGNPLQYSCLENPRDGGAWWAAVYGVAQSRTWLKRLRSSSMIKLQGMKRCFLWMTEKDFLDGIYSWWRCCEDCWNHSKGFRCYTSSVGVAMAEFERIDTNFERSLLWVNAIKRHCIL